MKRSALFLLAVGVLVLGFGALDARAGFVPLPTTLDQFVTSGGASNGNYTTVAGPNETDKFSDFSFSASVLAGAPPVLTPAGITLKPFVTSTEAGITFSGAFFVPAGTIVDYAIDYTVTAPKGHLLTDATLSGTFNGPGASGITETLIPSSGPPLTGLFINAPGGTDTQYFAGVQSIQVQKDILLVGGANGAVISIINQGFSSSGTVPEPASLALLGIGMTGFLAFRRFFKKTSIA